MNDEKDTKPYLRVVKGGRAPGIKGGRVEREIVKLHEKINTRSERVPLSGAARYQGNGEDVVVYPHYANYETPPSEEGLRCQVKAMDRPRGIKGVLEALGEADALFIRLDRQPGEANVRAPLVVLPWATWEKLLK